MGKVDAVATLRNFRIDTEGRWPSGLVRIRVEGAGPSMHELNMVRRDDTGPLPVNARGNVDDNGPTARLNRVGEVEGVDIAQQRTIDWQLPPGRYVLYCNMDGHYQAGMWTASEVTR